MSGGINEYLRNLIDKSKLNKLFADEETEVSLMLDLYTAEYKGARIKFIHKDSEVNIDTSDMSMVIYEGSKTTKKVDSMVALALDHEVISKFNIYKLEEDYFSDLEDSIESDIKDLYYKEAEETEKILLDKLKSIHESDYDEETIRNEFKKFEVVEKKDHLNLTHEKNGTSVKYNTGKSKFTIKNLSSYKNKFSPDEVINNFDLYKFNNLINSLNHKDAYNKIRMDLDDGMEDSYSSLGGLSYFPEGDLTE